MTADERVAALHQRMTALRRAREKQKTGAIGAACVVLALCLSLVIFTGSGGHPGGTASMYSGAAMLFEGSGGYVLAAVIAFMAGVIVTVLLIRRKNRKQDHSEKDGTGPRNMADKHQKNYHRGGEDR